MQSPSIPPFPLLEHRRVRAEIDQPRRLAQTNDIRLLIRISAIQLLPNHRVKNNVAVVFLEDGHLPLPVFCPPLFLLKGVEGRRSSLTRKGVLADAQLTLAGL